MCPDYVTEYKPFIIKWWKNKTQEFWFDLELRCETMSYLNVEQPCYYCKYKSSTSAQVWKELGTVILVYLLR